MIGSVSAHRRANAFAQALEEESPAQQAEAPETDPEQARLLGLAGQLASVPAPTLDPEVRTVQRAQLIAAMETMFAEGAAGDAADAAAPADVGDGPKVPAPRRRGAHRAAGSLSKLRPRSRFSRGVTIGGIGVGVAAGAFSGAAAASSDALPGDTLYGLKRGMEDLRRDLAHGDTERGRIYLDQASTRLNEARRLMERDRAGALDEESVGEVRNALDNVRRDAGEGHRLLRDAYRADGSLGPLQTLSAFSEKNKRSWQQLRDRLPAQLGTVGDEVSSVFDAIEQDVAPLTSMLPSQEDGGAAERDAPDGAEASGKTTDPRAEPTRPSGTASADGEVGEDGTPEPTTTEDGGLIGEGGLIGGGGATTPDDDRDTGSSSASSAEEAPKPEVTLPPLLPLPELGLDVGQGED